MFEAIGRGRGQAQDLIVDLEAALEAMAHQRGLAREMVIDQSFRRVHCGCDVVERHAFDPAAVEQRRGGPRDLLDPVAGASIRDFGEHAGGDDLAAVPPRIVHDTAIDCARKLGLHPPREIAAAGPRPHLAERRPGQQTPDRPRRDRRIAATDRAVGDPDPD